MHQPQASHLLSSTRMTPFSSDCRRASLRQALTHGASSQNLQAVATLTSGCRRTTLIRDLRGLKDPSFSRAQAYSQTPQPVHLLGSAETNRLALDFALSVIPMTAFPLIYSYVNYFSFTLIAFVGQFFSHSKQAAQLLGFMMIGMLSSHSKTP